MRKKILVVTAAIIECNGRYLITQRPPTGHLALKWEFPGGVVEFGENPKECLVREIEEELGIKIRVIDIFGYSSCLYDEKKHVILLGFLCEFLSGKIEKKGINDYLWVYPLEMRRYDFCEADIPFIEKLVGKKKGVDP